jgi:hypothetical protein
MNKGIIGIVISGTTDGAKRLYTSTSLVPYNDAINKIDNDERGSIGILGTHDMYSIANAQNFYAFSYIKSKGIVDNVGRSGVFTIRLFIQSGHSISDSAVEAIFTKIDEIYRENSVTSIRQQKLNEYSSTLTAQKNSTKVVVPLTENKTYYKWYNDNDVKLHDIFNTDIYLTAPKLYLIKVGPRPTQQELDERNCINFSSIENAITKTKITGALIGLSSIKVGEQILNNNWKQNAQELTIVHHQTNTINITCEDDYIKKLAETGSNNIEIVAKQKQKKQHNNEQNINYAQRRPAKSNFAPIAVVSLLLLTLLGIVYYIFFYNKADETNQANTTLNNTEASKELNKIKHIADTINIKKDTIVLNKDLNINLQYKKGKLSAILKNDTTNKKIEGGSKLRLLTKDNTLENIQQMLDSLFKIPVSIPRTPNNSSPTPSQGTQTTSRNQQGNNHQIRRSNGNSGTGNANPSTQNPRDGILNLNK